MKYGRTADIWIAIVGLLLVLVAMLALWHARSASRWRAEREELEKVISYLSEPEARGEPSGGAETELPEPPEIDGTWIFPIAASDYLRLTSPYGVRLSPILNIELYHEGVDIAATWRAQVVAAADGVVVEHWPVPGTRHPSGAVFRGHDVYGGMVRIEHEGGWSTLYAHLSETRVHTGQTVRAGAMIGRVGDTGKSRGAHLHLELRAPDGTPINPLLIVNPDVDRL